MTTQVILVSCPDQPGVIARVSQLLQNAGGNIEKDESHREESIHFDDQLKRYNEGSAQFVMRLVVSFENELPSSFKEHLGRLAVELRGSVRFYDPGTKQKVAILVSKDDTCLVDLLTRQRAGRLPCDIPLIISDEARVANTAKLYGVQFNHLPITSENQPQQEADMQTLLRDENIDFVILARYMRVLGEDFVEAYKERIINVHHGLLPAFKGAFPYQRAWERGVKVIGATAHYATAELDAGPIIAQEFEAVTHQYSAEELVDVGRDIERRVLAHAVKAWLEHRIIVHNGRTIVFH